MRHSKERGDESGSLVVRARAWLIRQFELSTWLLAAFAESDHRMDIEDAAERRTF
jgi:hypothetical protein